MDIALIILRILYALLILPAAVLTFGVVSSGFVIVVGILALLVFGIGQIFFPQLVIPYTITLGFLLVWMLFDKGYSGWH